MAQTVETHTTTVGTVTIRVDIHDDGDVMVEVGEGTWLDAHDLGAAMRFIEKHGDVDLRTM